MAINTIQFADVVFGFGFLNKSSLSHADQIARKVFLQRTVYLTDTDPGDDLPLFIKRNVINFTTDMPVNTIADRAGAGLCSTHL